MKIRTRLTLLLGGSLAGAFAVAMAAVAWASWETLRHSEHFQRQLQLDFLSRLAHHAAVTRDDSRLRETLAALEGAPWLGYVYAIDAQGRVIFDSERERAGPPAGEPARSGGADEWEAPVAGHGGARLRVGFSRDFAERSLRSMRARLLYPLAAVGLGGVLLSAMAGFSLAAALTRRIGELQGGTRDIAAGKFSVAVPVVSNDELDELARTFNHMASRLKELDALKDELVASMSHDLRNPLTSIILGASALEEGSYGPISDKQHRTVSMIIEGARRLNGMVENVLDAAKIKAGRLVVERRPVALGSLVAEVLELYRFQSEARRVALTQSVPADLPAVLADATALTRILSNLVGNALKFTPPGGSVSVTARDGGAMVSVRVADTGAGIPPEQLPRLFRPFEPGDAAQQPVGAGLGLSIVKSLAEANGGRVSVESRLGEGTTFTVELPRNG